MIANAPKTERARNDLGHGTPPAPFGRVAAPGLADYVPDDSAILWIGEIGGDAVRSLEERGCRIQALSVRPEAQPDGPSMLDLARLDFGRARFDVVIAADTLGRVANPEFLLKSIRAALRGNGRFLALVPNAAHPLVIRAVSRGESPYDSDGPLDDGQLRLFSADSFLTALEGADFVVGHLSGILDGRGQDVAAWFTIAYPLPIPGLERLQERFREATIARAEAETTAETLRSMLVQTRRALDASHLRADSLASQQKNSLAANVEWQKSLVERDREFERVAAELHVKIAEAERTRHERDAAHRHAVAAEARYRALEIRLEHVLMEFPRRVARKLHSFVKRPGKKPSYAEHNS